MRSLLSCVAVFLWAGFSALAQAPADSSWQAASSPSRSNLGASPVSDPPPIDTWIELLDSPRYSDRVEATQKLGRFGSSAMEALEQATARGGVEASDRAFDILKRHHDSDDQILKSAAAKSLRRIADQADHPKSKAAERFLTPAQPPPQHAIPFRFPILPVPNNINRRIQIQVKITNGDKDITVEENGKKIRVIENANGIQVEKSDGKGGVTKQTFKDVNALKEKDPDAHKAYKRAGANRVVPFNGPAMPVVPGQALKLPDDVRKRHEEILKQHQQMREKHKQILERLRNKQIERKSNDTLKT